MPLSYPLVVLAFTPAYVLFLSILVATDLSSTLSDLITLCSYILLRCLLSHRYTIYIQQCDYAFPTDHNDAYLHIPIVKYHYCILSFVWQHKPFQWKVLPSGLATAPRAFTSLTKPILFLLPSQEVFVFLFIQMISWS